MNRLSFVIRLLRRDLKAGELRLLVLTLILAISCVTAINYFTLAIKHRMGIESTNILGGDLVISSSQSMPSNWLTVARQYRLNHAQSISFMTVLNANERFQLAAIKAVSPNYPLLGAINTSDSKASAPPAPGSVYLEAPLFQSLNLAPSQSVALGSTSLKATRELTFDPSHSGGFFNLSPKGLMSLNDVAASRVIQPGSRITYNWFFTGNQNDIQAFKKWLEPRLTPANKILTASSNQSVLNTAFERMDNFLQISALLILLLCGLVVALSVRRFLQRHQQHIALMRSFGSSALQIIVLYSLALFIIGSFCILLGSLIGFALQPLLFSITNQMLTINQIETSLQPLMISLIYGYILLFGFSIPTLLSLKNIQAISLLKEQKDNFFNQQRLNIWVGLFMIALLCYWQLQDIQASLLIISGLGLAVLIFSLINYAIIRSLFTIKNKVGVSWRFGLANLRRSMPHAIAQILAFSLTITIALLVIMMWKLLTITWYKQLAPDAPNYFAFNIAPEQLPAVKKFFTNNQIKRTPVYPMVRARMTHVNGQKILTAVPESALTNNALHRELNLSWSATLPANNTVSSGEWWNTTTKNHDISIEKRLADDLGFQLGDVLTFQSGASRFNATIANIRYVDWTQLTPNFYVIFPNQQLLKNYPTTYINSFYLPANKTGLINEFISQFPNLSILNIANIMEQIRQSIFSLAQLISVFNIFILLAGIAILYASTLATIDRRVEEGLLLRVLGASKKQVTLGLLTEFFIIGLCASINAIVIANTLTYFLSTRILKIAFQFDLTITLISLIISPLLIATLGYLSTSSVRNKPLRDTINYN